MNLTRASVLAGLALLVVSATAGVAAAAGGYTTANVNQRQGPGTSYTVVDRIPVGSPVLINNCLRGGAWCDVTWSGRHGWVLSKFLQGTYQHRRVALPYYVPRLDIPIVTFGGHRDHRHHHFHEMLMQRHPHHHGPKPMIGGGNPGHARDKLGHGNCHPVNGKLVCK